jgi:hypothetical protein
MSSAPRRSVSIAIKSGWKISVCQAIWLGYLIQSYLASNAKEFGGKIKMPAATFTTWRLWQRTPSQHHPRSAETKHYRSNKISVRFYSF